MALSTLRLLLHAHRLALDAQHAHAAHEETLVDPGAPAERVVARPERRRAVEAQNRPDGRVGQVEGQPKLVADGEQVWARMQMCDDVVGRLRG